MYAPRYVFALSAVCAVAAASWQSVCEGQVYCYPSAAPVVYPVTVYEPSYIAYSPIDGSQPQYYASTTYYHSTAQPTTTYYPNTVRRIDSQPAQQPEHPYRAVPVQSYSPSRSYRVFERSGFIFAVDESTGQLWRYEGEPESDSEFVNRWKRTGRPINPN